MRPVPRFGVLAIAIVSLVPVALGADPKPGDMAPPFNLQGSDGRMYRLADYRGKQAVVVAWFAKAFTSG